MNNSHVNKLMQGLTTEDKKKNPTAEVHFDEGHVLKKKKPSLLL